MDDFYEDTDEDCFGTAPEISEDAPCKAICARFWECVSKKLGVDVTNKMDLAIAMMEGKKLAIK